MAEIKNCDVLIYFTYFTKWRMRALSAIGTRPIDESQLQIEAFLSGRIECDMSKGGGSALCLELFGVVCVPRLAWLCSETVR